MHDKKLYQIIKENQIIAVLLAKSKEDCENYALKHSLTTDLEYIDILEISKEKISQEDEVIPLMVAKKFSWYDLRHCRSLYLYQC